MPLILLKTRSLYRYTLSLYKIVSMRRKKVIEKTTCSIKYRLNHVYFLKVYFKS